MILIVQDSIMLEGCLKNYIVIPVDKYDKLKEAETQLEMTRGIIRAKLNNSDKVYLLAKLLYVCLEGENG